jgi:hypothetical protein
MLPEEHLEGQLLLVPSSKHSVVGIVSLLLNRVSVVGSTDLTA